MSEAWLFTHALPVWLALAPVVLVALLFRGAPYGRHSRAGQGPTVDSRIGWIVMELPSPLCMVLTFVTGRYRAEPWAWLFLAMWLVHYVNRTFVQPFRWRGKPTPIPWSIALSGAFFNLVNGASIGRWLFAVGPGYGATWFHDPRFVLGVLLFGAGMAINLHADEVLRSLRRPGERGYRVPHGGLYRWVSCPNYLGEIVEWCGFALCTFCLPAAAFAAWTVANLLPRAIAHHKWYRARFADYPTGRRALIPWVV